MHQDIRKVEITHPENPFDRVLKLEVHTADPLGLLEVLGRYLSGKAASALADEYVGEATRRFYPKDPLIDATRPAGTPRSEEQRALEDEAEAIGGVVTHAAGGVPVVVAAGEEPIGIQVPGAALVPGVVAVETPLADLLRSPVEPITHVGVDLGVAAPQTPTSESGGIPEVQKGDKVAFQTHDGTTYVLHDGKTLPADLQRLVSAAGGSLVIQKVSKRKDCVIALVEGGWAVKLIADAAGLPVVLEVKPPAVASQPPPRVDAPAAAAAAPSSPTPVAPATVKAAPAAAITDPALAGEVAKAMAMLPKLQAADGVRGVMEELLAAGCPHEQMYGVCNAIRESVACLKKQANLKDRVPRLLQIIGQG